jgi:hypothetical protein
MARAHFICDDGITVNELRSILSDCPAEDDDGNESIVFVLAGNGHLSPLTQVVIDDEGDTVLLPEFHVDLMEDLDTFTDFFGLEAEEDAEEAGELEPVGLN